ncbi:MAG: molybdate ABC transporter substrate-binding protein [bacterium]
MACQIYFKKPGALNFFRAALEKLFVYMTLLFWLAISFCDSSENNLKPLRIYAAASLTSVMPKLTQVFQENYPHAEIEFNFAASSILAKQIEYGAEADIFISANTQWMDFLENKNQIKSNTRIDFLSNKLVLIVSVKNKSTITSLQDLNQPFVHRIALADWAHVPAGLYAKVALENSGLWENIQTKCIPALDVRAALSYVERGEADCGIVYLTDAAISKNVKIITELPFDVQSNIRYSGATTKNSTHPLSKFYLSFLLSSEAKKILKQQGFVIMEGMLIE